MEILGIRIPTVVSDNVARRCDGCRGIVDGTPWRVNILDIVAVERPPSWSEGTVLNPGPFQFHPDPSHVRAWMRERGFLFCRLGDIREIMRPVPVPAAEGVRWGLCDGLHRDDHEFVPA